jgi:hypothetical protein
LSRYIAASAHRTSASTVAPPSGQTASPTLAVTVTADRLVTSGGADEAQQDAGHRTADVRAGLLHAWMVG